MKFKMLIVDPQNDFTLHDGALAVPNAIKSMDRVANLISQHEKKLDDIFITLDSHYDLHIAHPVLWTDENGKHPDPFTLINNSDIQQGIWRTPLWFSDWALKYTAELEKTGKYQLCIWPPHCIIGSEGACIYKPVLDAVRTWETNSKGIAIRLTKGSNFYTENYGVFSAEVPRIDDPKTQFDPSYLDLLNDCDRLYIVGEASSHCVKRSVEQLIENCGTEHLSKFFVVSDCMDAVAGFEHLETEFFENVRNAGGNVITSSEMFS